MVRRRNRTGRRAPESAGVRYARVSGGIQFLLAAGRARQRQRRSSDRRGQKAEDGDALIVRFHEYKGGRGTVRLESDLTFVSWQETDLMERPAGELNRGPAELQISPYEIKTVRLEFR
ncbi:hypothetical protein HMSSN036_96720 [Paenibacillus macerans]|nr:hypothetical protein HMSSN036_96720 [Paenibacillus macerans]